MGEQGRRTTPKGTEARARVITEATRIFARDGYRSGALSAIASAAGLTQQGLLHYFPNKAALLLAVVTERDSRTAAFLAEHAGSEAALDIFVDGVRHNMGEPHLVELMTVLSAESTSPEHPTHSWFVDRYEELVARLSAGVILEQEAGRWTSAVEPITAARMLIGLADGLRLQRLLGHPELDHARLLGEMIGWFRSGQIA